MSEVELTEREKRVAGLTALGWTENKIATHLVKRLEVERISRRTVRNDIFSAIRKLGLSGRVSLALWALDNTIGIEKRADMKAQAEKYREAFREEGGLLTEARVCLLGHLSDRATCDLSNTDLGSLCTPKLSDDSVGSVLNPLLSRIGLHPSKLKLAVVLYLAPLSERRDALADDL